MTNLQPPWITLITQYTKPSALTTHSVPPQHMRQYHCKYTLHDITSSTNSSLVLLQSKVTITTMALNTSFSNIYRYIFPTFTVFFRFCCGVLSFQVIFLQLVSFFSKLYILTFKCMTRALAKLLEILSSSPINTTPTHNLTLFCWCERSQNYDR